MSDLFDHINKTTINQLSSSGWSDGGGMTWKLGSRWLMVTEALLLILIFWISFYFNASGDYRVAAVI